MKRPVGRWATLGQLLADIPASGEGDAGPAGDPPPQPGALREAEVLRFVSSGGITATRAARCSTIPTLERDAEGGRGCWKHMLSHFSPTSVTAEDSWKGAGRRCGVQRLGALLMNEGPQSPSVPSRFHFYVCVFLHVCVCVYMPWGVPLCSPSLSLGFYLPQEPCSTPRSLTLF